MKKTQRMLLGCIATCFCFFASMLAGSFTDLKADVASSSGNAVQEHSDLSDDKSQNSETPSPDHGIG
ncbi:MAG: hypothetical protein IJ274_00020, partial [Lachnospiraceae bacterium]|nr:hypothetical protein [Lachnospiraceae bacterium]